MRWCEADCAGADVLTDVSLRDGDVQHSRPERLVELCEHIVHPAALCDLGVDPLQKERYQSVEGCQRPAHESLDEDVLDPRTCVLAVLVDSSLAELGSPVQQLLVVRLRVRRVRPVAPVAVAGALLHARKHLTVRLREGRVGGARDQQQRQAH